MKITAEEITVNDLFSRATLVFKVPVYQRPYSWGKEQWEELWDDLCELENDDTHYLGSIVVVSDALKVAGFDRLEVVDGQQRLTTLSIVFAALRDFYKKKGDTESSEEIERQFLRSRNLKQTERKLTLGRGDDSDYQQLVSGQAPEESRVGQACQFFTQKIEEADGVDAIVSKLTQGMQLVMINTGSHENAFKLFETLNDRGLELSAADLIKNHMLSRAAANSSLEALIEIWDRILASLEDVDKLRFFRQYLMATRSGKASKSRLYDLYKEDISSAKDLDDYANRLARAAEAYATLVSLNFKSAKLNAKVQDLLNLKAIPSFTLLLRLILNGWTEEKILTVIPILETVSLRRSICGWSTGEIDSIFNQLAVVDPSELNLERIREFLVKVTPDDNEFFSKFYLNRFRQDSQTKYILEMLELDLMKTSEKKVLSVHLEHIMPVAIHSKKCQKSQGGDWAAYLGEEAKRHDEFRNRIGNFTLLASELNIPASNNPFEAKKKFYAKSQILLTQALCVEADWRIAQIEARSKSLAERAVSIWAR